MPIEERTIGSRKIHPKHLLIERAAATIELSQSVVNAGDKETWLADLYSRTALVNPSGSLNIDGVATTAGMYVYDGGGVLWVTSTGTWSQNLQQPTPGDLVSIASGSKYGGQTLLVTNDRVRTANASIVDGYSNPDPIPDVPDNTSRLVPQNIILNDESIDLAPYWRLAASEPGSVYQLSCSVQIVTNVLAADTRCYLDVYRDDAFYARLDSRIIRVATPVSLLVMNGSLLVAGDGEYDLRIWATVEFNVPVVQGYEKLLRITAHRLR